MNKVIERKYNKEELEMLVNKTWYKFLWFIDNKMIFQYKEKQETSRQITEKTKTEKFFDCFLNKDLTNQDFIWVINELNIENTQENKEKILGFINYWLEKWERDNKYKWQKQNTFEITARLRTRFSNNFNNKKVVWWIAGLD